MREAKRRVDEIAGMRHDGEMAHLAEDELLWAFVESVADGNVNGAPAVAIEVLKSRALKFARVYS